MREMTDPLSLLLAKKQAVPKASAANAAVPSRAPASGSKSPPAGQRPDLFDVESTLGSNFMPKDPTNNSVVGSTAESACQRIDRALHPSSNVDFPTITDICERVAAEPSEAVEAVGSLLGAFGNSECHYRRRLKALTIMNELVYDHKCAEELRKMPMSLNALRELQMVRGTGLGDASDEHIRMFAHELEKKCFSDTDKVEEPELPQRKRDKLTELLGELGSSIQAIAVPSGADLPDASARKRDLAKDLFGEVGSSIQANISALGSSILPATPAAPQQHKLEPIHTRQAPVGLTSTDEWE